MSIWLAAAIIVGAVGVACGLMYAIHRLGTKDVFLADTTRGAGVYAVAGTAFAVLLAFVVLVAYESYNDAKAGAQAEADAVLELFRNAEYFPPAEHQRLQGELVCYARAVVEQDWPAMRDGTRSRTVDSWAFRLANTYKRLTVETPKQEAAFSNALEVGNDRIEGRRERLSAVNPVVTTPVWFFLGLGAIVNIAFVLVFIDRRTESFTPQASLIATITTIVVAGLLLVWYLDHPYENQAGSIRPSEMVRTVAAVRDEFPGVNPPCPLNGAPIPARPSSASG